MKRFFAVLGIAAAVGAILTIGLAGSVFAADGNPGAGTQNQGVVCPCDNCEPNDYSYSYNYLEPGPHGTADTVSTDEGTQTQHKGDVCPCGDCEPNDYSGPGPHGLQKGVSD